MITTPVSIAPPASPSSGAVAPDGSGALAGRFGGGTDVDGQAGTPDEPGADACLRAYRRDAAGRLALAALGQHHGPLS
jgi:hypothetical protein